MKPTTSSSASIALLALLTISGSATAQVVIEAVPGLPTGGTQTSGVRAISDDGLTLAGFANRSGFLFGTPMYWRSNAGTLPLPIYLPQFFFDSGEVVALNQDGSIGVGLSSSDLTYSVKWSINAGTVEPIDLSPFDISDSGEVIVGSIFDQDIERAATKVASNPASFLPNLANHESDSRAISISGDGSVVVGYCTRAQLLGQIGDGYGGTFDVFAYYPQVTRWTAGVPQGLGFLPGHDRSSNPIVSDDGRVVFAISERSEIDPLSLTQFVVERAIVRSVDGGPFEPILLDNDLFFGAAINGVSGDGARASFISGLSGYIWDADAGLWEFQALLNELGADLSGFAFFELGAGMSDDATRISAFGPFLAYRVTLPAVLPLAPSVCIADFDNNGGVDGGDLAAFFAAFESGDGSADVDANGGVDGGDLAFFFERFEAGC